MFAFAHLFFLFVAGTLYWESVLYYFLLAGMYLLVTHVLRLEVLLKSDIQKWWPNFVLRLVLIIVLLGGMVYCFQLVLSYFLGIIDLAKDFSFFYALVNIVMSVIYLGIWTLVYYVYHFVNSHFASLQYKAALHEMELNFLKSQLNPHFIFNALNSIRALVGTSPEDARMAVTKLSTILRQMLQKDKTKLYTLAEELELVRDYLDLEKIRYEDRLHIEWEINAPTNQLIIPPMLLQTIVENGIKHGISKLVKGGVISIRARHDEEHLYLSVINSGKLGPAESTSTGKGLANAKQRLQLIYGELAHLSIQNIADDRVETRIELPLDKK